MAEFLLHRFKFGIGRIAQHHPEETVFSFEVVADLFNGKVYLTSV